MKIFKPGDRVRVIELEDDDEMDEGTVKAVEGDNVTVAWDVCGDTYEEQSDELEIVPVGP